MSTMYILTIYFLIHSGTCFLNTDTFKYSRDNKINKAVWVKSEKWRADQPAYHNDFIFRSGPIGDDNTGQSFFGDDLEDNGYMRFFDRSKRSIPDLNIQPTKYPRFVKNEENVSIWQHWPIEYLTVLLRKGRVKTSSDRGKNINDALIYMGQNFDENANVKAKRDSVQDDNIFRINTDSNKTINSTAKSRDNRNVFDKKKMYWPSKPKYTSEETRSENGLNMQPDGGFFRLLTAITKALKKVMNQFDQIKKVKIDLKNVEDNFNRNIQEINDKIREFNLKYDHFTDFGEKITKLELKFNHNNQEAKNKILAMVERIKSFENHMQKYEAKQNIIDAAQELLQAETKRINSKQQSIYKTQMLLTRRQNKLGSIVKKIKHFIDNQKSNCKEQNESVSSEKLQSSNTTEGNASIVNATESIKIDLLPAPVLSEIRVNDNDLLRDKDRHDIDDLIYKYYFNNTFIDTIKSKLMSNSISSESGKKRNAKVKRNEDVGTTLLYPVDRTDQVWVDGVQRHKRWIRHHAKNKNKRLYRGKTNTVNEINDAKSLKKENSLHGIQPALNMTSDDKSVNKSDPFDKMAINFCNEIVKDKNKQNLAWCVEKALRRLRNIDTKFTAPKTMPTSSNDTKTNDGKAESVNITNFVTPSQVVTVTNETQATTTAFFPGNDEIEANLKEFEMKPDLEGNVYYDDRSVHLSDIVQDDDVSEFMKGFESNSRVELDPVAFVIHDKRQAYVQKFNDGILKKTSKTDKMKS